MWQADDLILAVAWMAGACIVFGGLALLSDLFERNEQSWGARAVRWICGKLGI